MTDGRVGNDGPDATTLWSPRNGALGPRERMTFRHQHRNDFNSRVTAVTHRGREWVALVTPSTFCT